MADDAPSVLLSSPVAMAQALAGMAPEERVRWRLADLPGRPSPAERGLDIPFPVGWFPAMLSTELAAGEVKPLRYMGQDLVVWRGGDGRARMLDAHCRHLGAHMGHKLGGHYGRDPQTACGFEADKLARNIQVQREARNLKNPPTAEVVFDASFLPPAAERMIK